MDHDHAVIALSYCASVAETFQRASRPATVISRTVFDVDIVFAAITATFLAVVDRTVAR